MSRVGLAIWRAVESRGNFCDRDHCIPPESFHDPGVLLLTVEANKVCSIVREAGPHTVSFICREAQEQVEVKVRRLEKIVLEIPP